jgi:hypothetical protein
MWVGEWEHPLMKNQEALDLAQAFCVKKVLMILRYLHSCVVYIFATETWFKVHGSEGFLLITCISKHLEKRSTHGRAF